MSLNLHLFNFDNHPPSVERINPLLTINGQTTEPLFVYTAQDAKVNEWPANGYGKNLILYATQGINVGGYNRGSPLLGNRDDAIELGTTLFGNTIWMAPSGSDYTLTSEDIIIRIIYKVDTSFNNPPLASKAKYSDGSGYNIFAGKYTGFVFNRGAPGWEDWGTWSDPLPNGWVDVVHILDASGYGQSYVNGQRSGTPILAKTPPLSSYSEPFYLGLSWGTDAFHGTFSYLSLWKKDDWLDSHLQDALVAKMFAELTGIYPESYTGTPTPTFSRNSSAFLEKYESGIKKIYQVGTNWPRTCYKKDSNNENIYGYLSESQSTNLLLQSETLGTTWTQVALTSIASNDAYGPNSFKTLDGLIGSASDTQHGITQTITLTADTYCLSCWVRPGNKTWCYLFNSTVSNCYVYFNLLSGETGTIGNSVIDHNIEQYDTDLYRIWITFTGTVASHTVGLYAANNDGDNDFAGDTTTVNIHAGCFQCEQNTYASSYIPTTTASVTRSADVLRYNGDNVSENQGQIFATVLPYSYNDGYICSLNFDGSVDNSIKVRKDEIVSSIVTTESERQYSLDGHNSIVDGYVHYIQHSWSENGSDLSVDFESEAISIITASIPSINRIEVGGDSTKQFNGLIKDFKIFSTYVASTNAYNTKDWVSNYPNFIDTNAQMPTLTRGLDKFQVAQIHTFRNVIIELEKQVGSNLVETNSLRDRVNKLTNILHFESVKDLMEYPIESLEHLKVVYVDGYYQVGDGGGEKKYLDLSMTLGGSAANGGTVIYANDGLDYSDSRKAYWRSVNWSGDVRVFGTKGEQDDSKAFAAAIKEACEKSTIAFVNSTVYLRTNIFMYGMGCLKGTGTIICDGISAPSDPGQLVAYFGLGITGPGSLGTGIITNEQAAENTIIWKGFIEDITFIVGPRSNVSTLFLMLQCYGSHIKNVRLYARSNSGKSMNFTYQEGWSPWWVNNSGGPTTPYGQKAVTIENCDINVWATSTYVIANGGIDFSASGVNCSNIRILYNTVVGSVDDILAFHGARKSNMIGNMAKPLLGRMLINSSRDGVFSYNYVEKLTELSTGEKNVGIWCYYTDVEQCLAGKPGRNIISNNIAKIPNVGYDESSFVGFRISCSFDTEVSSNLIIINNNTPKGQLGMELASYRPPIDCIWIPGNSDDDSEYPYTYYPDTVPGFDGYYHARNYNVKILNNMSVGKFPQAFAIHLSVPDYDSKNLVDYNYFPYYNLYSYYPLAYQAQFGKNYFNDSQTEFEIEKAYAAVPHICRTEHKELCFYTYKFTAGGSGDFYLYGLSRFSKYLLYKNYFVMVLKVQLDQALIGTDTITIDLIKDMGTGPGPSFTWTYPIAITSPYQFKALSYMTHLIPANDIVFKQGELIKIAGTLTVSDISAYVGSAINVRVSVEGIYI